MKLTTKNIISMLPFDSSFKAELLEKYDSLDENSLIAITEIIWDTYYALYRLKLDENIQLAFARAAKNQEKLDDEFYKRVQEQTERQLNQDLSNTVGETDLAAARKAMELIMQEIKASKARKKN